ncbi:hypothetical protein NLM59_06020 [Weeksellaceae bacterium KMM 9724]|uniref:hypothetical protein n=1 Tax=Profundicola chukchiensis TaxID=2961959 RepID=UPI00243C55DA|nr:hypothetical protein [Profundicola chukchiensis]MDG4950472.1 hypothetical protein [Profundicola chukchiensis]
MRTLIILLMIFSSMAVYGQNVDDFFVPSANYYLQDKTEDALDKVNQGLEAHPNNKKLLELKKKIEEQKERDKERGKNNEGKEQDDNAKQNPEENNSQQDSPQDDGRNRGEDGTGSSQEDPMNADGEEPSENIKDQGERLQKERYDNILKALENQEQDTQRRLMMGNSKSKLGRKQKDW